MVEQRIIVEMIQASDTYSNWVSSNPIINSGRIVYDSTNKKMKIGDGVTPWKDLPYICNIEDLSVIDGGTY